MQVQDIMTSNPTCCEGETTIQEAAKLMVEQSIGALPVLNDTGEPLGVVTDRDICCRAVAEGKSGETAVSDVMSTDVLTTSAEEEVSSCCNKMEERQMRRAVVIDSEGKCCGVVAQADVARESEGTETADLVQKVSEPESRSGCC